MLLLLRFKHSNSIQHSKKKSARSETSLVHDKEQIDDPSIIYTARKKKLYMVSRFLNGTVSLLSPSLLAIVLFADDPP
jgi:hypothetical protein